MAVFLFIIGAAIGIFISIVKSQKKVLVEQQLVNQVSYVKEYMSKALRAAKVDSIGDYLGNKGDIYLLTHYDIGSGSYKGIKFINSLNSDICEEFYFDSPNGTLQKVAGIGNSPVPLTSADIGINFSKSRFIINGSTSSGLFLANNSDDIQPRVTILLNISVSGQAPKIIQTTVSQRNLNVPQQ